MPWINRDLEERKKQKRQQDNRNFSQEPDEIEATVEHTRHQAINRSASVFDNASIQEGINTRKSTFDQNAVFHTEKTR